METSGNLIQVRHLRKQYNHGAIHALDDVSVDVNKGDVIAVIGPSGSSKFRLRSSVLLPEPRSTSC